MYLAFFYPNPRDRKKIILQREIDLAEKPIFIYSELVSFTSASELAPEENFTQNSLNHQSKPGGDRLVENMVYTL